ncbi:MAG: hypothetical protein JO231_21770 [Acidobacteria bacterium]|nr:hypothetical protein [Acidobacteriota bacterium]
MFQNINIISLVGGAVAASAAGKLLLSAKYPGTWPLVCRHSSAFWRYVVYYGLLGALVTGIILRTELGHFQVIAGIPREIFWPIIVGLVGTLAKFSFVGSVSDAHHFQMTARAVLVLFEPPLLEQIKRNEFFALSRIIRKHLSHWPDLEALKQTIKRYIPDRIENAERLEFVEHLEKQSTVEGAMILFYRFVGRDGFEFVFNQPPPAQRTTARPPATALLDIPIRPAALDMAAARRKP